MTISQRGSKLPASRPTGSRRWWQIWIEYSYFYVIASFLVNNFYRFSSPAWRDEQHNDFCGWPQGYRYLAFGKLQVVLWPVHAMKLHFKSTQLTMKIKQGSLTNRLHSEFVSTYTHRMAIHGYFLNFLVSHLITNRCCYIAPRDASCDTPGKLNGLAHQAATVQALLKGSGRDIFSICGPGGAPPNSTPLQANL